MKTEAASVRTELAIGGMTCAACATRVERVLNRIDGVEATVNYATEKATVQCPPTVPAETLVRAVSAAGYRAEPVSHGLDEDRHGARARDLRHRLAVAAVLTIPLCDFSITLELVPRLQFPGWKVLCLLLALPVVFWCAAPFHRATLKNLRHRSVSMDTLVSLGVLAAFGWSTWSLLTESVPEATAWFGLGTSEAGTLYFCVAAGVTTFLLSGRYFEARAKSGAASLLTALDALVVKQVRILRDGAEAMIDSAMLRRDDTFVVKPGERMAADGVVVSGRSAIDTSTLTGESLPVEAGPGDRVFGGTTVLNGRLIVTATDVGETAQVSRMAALTERALADKARVQRLVDRVCSVFVPVVLTTALLTFAGWLTTGHPLADGFAAAVSVLIIACPCALGLATPTALLAGIGRGAQLGILLKGAEALEVTRAVDIVVLDKTGTLTTGRMTVAAVHAVGVSRAELLRLAGAVESASEHPLGVAIAAAAAPVVAVDDFRALPGIGVHGRVDGAVVTVGAVPDSLTVAADIAAAAVQARVAGATVVFVTRDASVLGFVALADQLRDSAAAGVHELHRLGLRTLLLTGDHEVAAGAVAESIGVREWRAGVLPADKAHIIRELQEAGHCVAMAGDGVNDAAALATADIGIAVGDGSDLAMRAADVVLVRDDLRAVADTVRLARRTVSTIRGNLAWAFAYNVAAIPLATLGLLNPLIAGAAMSLSSVLVVSNSMRLQSFTSVSSPENGVRDD